MNIIQRLFKSKKSKIKNKKLNVEDLKHCFLTDYGNGNISLTLKNVKFSDGEITDVRVNGKWVLLTSHFLHTQLGYKGMKPNAFIIIEYNIRFPSDSSTLTFKRTKHDMGIITRSYVTFGDTVPFGEDWTGKVDLESYIQRIIHDHLGGNRQC